MTRYVGVDLQFSDTQLQVAAVTRAPVRAKPHPTCLIDSGWFRILMHVRFRSGFPILLRMDFVPLRDHAWVWANDHSLIDVSAGSRCYVSSLASTADLGHRDGRPV